MPLDAPHYRFFQRQTVKRGLYRGPECDLVAHQFDALSDSVSWPCQLAQGYLVVRD